MSNPVWNLRKSPHVSRLVACLVGSVVLAIMWGPQEGGQQVNGDAFRQAVVSPRVFVFLLLGLIAFAVITFWPLVKPYLVRPGAWPLIAGLLTVLASIVLMHWDDQIDDAKFNTVADQVVNTGAIAPLSRAFFGYLYWVDLLLAVLLAGAAIATRRKVFGYLGAAVSVFAAVLGLLAHHSVIAFTGGTDHSTGQYVHAAGYFVVAAAGLAAVLSHDDVAQTRAFVSGVFGWRPGLVLVVVGAILSVLALASATWFAPLSGNDTLADTHDLFEGTGLSALAVQYLIWLGWALLIASVVLAGAGSYLRNRVLSWAGALVGVVAVVLTLITLYDITSLAADTNFDGATGPWQNLGVGGWLACLGLSMVAGGALVAATTRPPAPEVASVVAKPGALRAPSRISLTDKLTGQYKSLVLAGLAIALFYPPMATQFWQKVLVTEIGVYVLLAVGLNVVVGWAGLLDLGFIAFFAIGSYTAAYLVGGLPVKPPDWLQLSPLLAIPFAIALCLGAGLLLGAPTLRLRGDYLAIVTLGFGEIIRIIAVNNPGNLTNGPRGASSLPHPVIHIGPLHLVWGLDSLPYWYLLVLITVIVVVLFYRLEGSRLGRAWAAIREDEVAAQATGINTTRVKLLAFAIGASTSGVAGVFFATSGAGFINPDDFVLANSILVVAYVVFGGMGSLPGAMAGAAVLTWLPEFLKDQLPQVDRQMWIGAIVVLMMIFRPAGLVPARRRRAELTGLDAASSSEVAAVPRAGAL
jgi:ABC-type branched-subunit amino acid transport system permease subunit